MQQVIFGLGSNLEDRGEHLSRALAMLEREIGPLVRSSVYETPPLLPPDAPQEWALPYYNMAAYAFTADTPVSLLAIAKMCEQALGRQDRGRWGPREIDIDILALGDTVIRSRTLTLPHRSLLKRDFALVPLAEAAPAWRYPLAGEMQGVAAKDIVRRLGYGEALSRVDISLA